MLPEHFRIETVIEAARAGGAVLKNYFGQTLETTRKSTAADFRTKADLESEQAVIKILSEAFPDYNIFSEEIGSLHRGSSFTFVIDPLDGTNNFVLGIPMFSVSIALFENNQVLAGVIYLPCLDLVYSAKKGEGAFVGTQPIQVNSIDTLEKASIAHNCNYETPPAKIGAAYSQIISRGAKRMITSWCPTSDYCLLASGKIEGLLNYGTEVYDFAAGKLIAEEAGAKTTLLTGEPLPDDKQTEFIISNGTHLHSTLLDLAKL